MAIWSEIQRQFKRKLATEVHIKRKDKGLLYLGLAISVWSFSAFLNIIYYHFDVDNWLKIISQNMFSILNSLFLILALYYFDHSPNYIYNNKKSIKRIIIFFVVLSLLSLVLAFTLGDTLVAYGFRLNTLPDLLLSAVLSWFLILTLFRTFRSKNLHHVAILSVLSVVLLFLAQLYLVFDLNDFDLYIDWIKILSKTTLIFLFLVLGTIWVIELAQLPEAKTMKIHFTTWNQLVLTIPAKNIINKEVSFGKKTTQFNNLLKFAIRRKYASEEHMCIEVYNGGEILNQTYLTRIIENINNILELKADDKLKRNDFFTFIGNAKYSLRFLPEHITINNALLQEFIANTPKGIYREIANYK